MGLNIAGRYRLLEQIGSGGMSDVYRAEEIAGGRIVALKLMHADRHADPKLAHRMFAEAQAAARIKHPGIAEVYDVGVGETGPYIAMEFLDGISAADLLAELGRIGVLPAVATVVPVLDALDAAHAAGVVHRDLKPENVFYAFDADDALSVKLLDFGVAKLLEHDGQRTSTGIVLGTPDYLSPEQANGDTNLDGRSDVFAVGVLLFELITDIRPFHAPTAVATAYKIAHQKAPSLSEFGGPVLPLLDTIISRALEKRPELRFASAHDFKSELVSLFPDQRAARLGLMDLIQRPGKKETFTRKKPLTPAPVHTPSDRSSEPRSFVLPRRFIGRCHVRGAVLAALDAYVEREYGAPAREDILAKLPVEFSREFADAGMQSIAFFDLEALTLYLEHVTHDLAGGDPSWARAAGVSSAETELDILLRTAKRADSPYTLLRRAAPVFSRFFDFGQWEAARDERSTVLRITDFEPASSPLRRWIVGGFASLLTSVFPDSRVEVQRGEGSFAPQLVLEVSEPAAKRP